MSNSDTTHEIIKLLNARLNDKVEDIIFVAECLATIFPDRLPVQDWTEWGIKTTVTLARDLKRIASCPDLCNPANFKLGGKPESLS